MEKGECCSCVDIPRLLTFNQLLRLLDYVVLDIRPNQNNIYAFVPQVLTLTVHCTAILNNRMRFLRTFKVSTIYRPSG